MKARKIVTAILGGVTVVAPILNMLAESITRDREMDEIADRVVKRLESKKENSSDDIPEKEEK